MKYDKEELTKSVEEQLKAGMSEKDILNRLAEAGLEPIDARLLYVKAKHPVGDNRESRTPKLGGANMIKDEDISGWKGFFFGMGIVLTCIAVIGSVYSLVINPSWHHVVLLLAVLAAWIVVLVSNKRWIQIPFFTALGIFVIYTIRGIILGNIEWIYPGGGIGP